MFLFISKNNVKPTRKAFGMANICYMLYLKIWLIRNGMINQKYIGIEHKYEDSRSSKNF